MLTRQLAESVAALDFKRIPAAAVDTVKRGFIDCIGVMFAGRDEPVVRVLLNENLLSDKREARILFDRGMTSSPDAALLNATAGHALDYDDVAIDGHPSVVLVPAVLAEGERLRATRTSTMPRAGIRARCSVQSRRLRLAAKGFTASPDALEHRGGFLAAFSPAGRFRVDGPLGEWHILKNGLNIKRYPVCYALHRSIDGLIFLLSRNKTKKEEVKEVELSIGKLQAGMLRHSRPRNALDAKFSAEFAAASAVVAGRVGLAELSDGFVRSAPVQQMLEKVKVTPVDDPDPEEPLFSRSDQVRVTLSDGTVLAGEPVQRARGHAHNPLGIEDLRAKFEDCVNRTLPVARREALFDRLLKLERLVDPTVLCGDPA